MGREALLPEKSPAGVQILGRVCATDLEREVHSEHTPYAPALGQALSQGLQRQVDLSNLTDKGNVAPSQGWQAPSLGSSHRKNLERKSLLFRGQGNLSSCP